MSFSWKRAFAKTPLNPRWAFSKQGLMQAGISFGPIAAFAPKVDRYTNVNRVNAGIRNYMRPKQPTVARPSAAYPNIGAGGFSIAPSIRRRPGT